ncbi:MAG TPA: hypothetical protein VI365_25925 [Trebonia sp.]
MSRKLSKKVTGMSALLGAAMAAAASLGMAPAASAATGSSWQGVADLQEAQNASLTSIVMTSPSTGYVFQSVPGSRPAAYSLSGSKLKQVPFQSDPGEVVVASAESSASNVWAFASLPDRYTEAIKLVNGRWDPVKTLGGRVTQVSVRSAKDVTVFGPLGTYHFNGSTWTRQGGAVSGGYSVAGTDDWTYEGTTVTHLVNGKAKNFNLVKDLPPQLKPAGMNDPAVDGVIALTDRNVYAIGSGNAEDAGGPTWILHYDGSTWKKIASYGREAEGQPVSDGGGGFWEYVWASGACYVLHYSAGKLSATMLPLNGGEPNYITALALAPGSRDLVAVSNTQAADGQPKFYGEVESLG